MSALHSDAASEPTRCKRPRWLAQIDRVVLAAVVVLTTLFFICVVLQVFVRYVLEESLPWTEEVSRYSFIWASFLTAAVIVGRGEHFSIDFILEMIPARLRCVMRIVTTTLCLSFTLLLMFYGARWSLRQMIATSPILEIPQGLVYSIVPLAALHMSVHLSVHLLLTIGELRRIKAKQ